MPKLERSFIAGAMNKDDDERQIQPGQYREAWNIDITSTEGEDSGAVKNKLGNSKIGDLSNVCGVPVDSTFECIGSLAVQSEYKLYYLIASDYFDGVFEYNEISGNITRVLQSSKATPSTASQLNFNKSYYVTGFNYIDGFLSWTDNLNEPFFGKVSRWKSYNIDDDRIDRDVKLIKAPPLHSPIIEMINETEEENNMEDRFIQFAYRYRYVDNQYSSFSPFSSVAFDPGTFELDYAVGNNKAVLNTKNRVNIKFETGNEFVKSVELLFRDTKDKNVRVIDTFDKDKEGIPDNFIHDFQFDNDKAYTVVTDDQLVRLWDNVPIKAKAQEVIGSRLIFGNYVEFFDIKDSSGEEINIVYDVEYISEEVSENVGTQTFRSDRDYEVGIIYGDDDGRFTTVQTSKSNTVYIKPKNSVTANSLVVNIYNDAPAFATNYRVVVKQSKQGYYNIFPVLYYVDGIYRYFMINQSDVDKIKVGEYIIFKSDGSSATLSNKDYKILEIEAKSENFLSGNTGSELPGVYFKIKVDGNDFPASNIDTYSTSAYGANDTNVNAGVGCSQDSFEPIDNHFNCAEDPIFYGTSDYGSSLSIANSWYYAPWQDDIRVYLEIYSTSGNVNTFRYKLVGNNSTTSQNQAWSTPTPITANTALPIVLNGITGTAFSVIFSQDSGFDVGDSWRINCRGNLANTSQSVFGGSLPLLTYGGVSNNSSSQHGGFAIIPSDNFPEQINAGAQIKIEIVQDSPVQGGGAQPAMTFTSSKTYANIEEWFFEDGIYDQWDQINPNTGLPTGPGAVYFRRGTNWGVYTVNAGTNNVYQVNTIDQGGSPTSTTMDYPVRMIIKGYGVNDGCDQNKFIVNYYVTQLDTPLFCETKPIENDVDIFHEITDTYPIVNGKHHVLWDYEDFTDGGGGYTRIGQATPGAAPGAQRPHKFIDGNTINVNTTTSWLNGTWTVLDASDPYNVIVDALWGGSGPVTPGTAGLTHGSNVEEIDQTSSQGAKIIINHPQNPNCTYNAYTFGNGLESNRILDDFNETTVQYSPRVVTIIDGYKQERKESSVTYSNVYRAESSINRLNEFNLAKGNYKDLDKSYGSIQKLYGRDSDLVVFQENKVSKTLYEKNLISDSIGGGTVTSIPEVLGTQIPFSGEWGISSNPESFAEWGGEVYFTDARRGAVLKMTSGGTYDISLQGMKSYFRDLFKDSPNTKKIGVYDPHQHEYVLASNDDSSVPCSLTINRDSAEYSADQNPAIEVVNDSRPDFVITSNTDWTISIVYSAGTGWVTGYPESGFGNQDVHLGIGDNTTGAVRTATLTITYCGGLTETFTITQGASPVLNVITWIMDNKLN